MYVPRHNEEKRVSVMHILIHARPDCFYLPKAFRPLDLATCGDKAEAASFPYRRS